MLLSAETRELLQVAAVQGTTSASPTWQPCSTGPLSYSAVSGKRSRAGFPIWLSEVEPGGVHDLTAAREHVLGALDAAAAAGLPTLADPGYEGAGMGVHTPGLRGQEL